MYFEHIGAFFLLFLPIILIFFFKKKFNYKKYFTQEMFDNIFINHNATKNTFILLLICYILVVIAIAQPVLLKQNLQINSNKINIVVALDMSKSMTCTDKYPSRFAFAKAKLLEFVTKEQGFDIAIIGFSNFSFLVCASTSDKNSLTYLINHTKINQVQMQGTSIFSALKSTNWLLKQEKNKILILFTDGGGKSNFNKEISYAVKHHIRVFVSAVGTLKGTVIKTSNKKILKSNGNIVISRLNPLIKILCEKTGGIYTKADTTRTNINKIIKTIKQKYGKNIYNKNSHNDTQLYYIPLSFAVFLFLLSLIGVRR